MKINRRDLEFDPVFLTLDGKPGPPGPKGEKGDDAPPARNGVDGRDGADAQGWTYRGEWRRTASYEAGDVISYDGSSYLALADSRGSSPPSKAWGLLAARGEDGEAGLGQRGRPGRDGTTTIVTAGEGSPTAAIFDATASKGMPVYVSSDGHVDLAQADTLATASVIGLAAADVGEGFAGLVITNGEIELEDWSAVLGSEHLSPGLAVYLALGGGLSHDAPEPADGVCVTYVGRALSETRLLVEVSEPIALVEPEE